jgi:hypothetical protein
VKIIMVQVIEEPPIKRRAEGTKMADLTKRSRGLDQEAQGAGTTIERTITITSIAARAATDHLMVAALAPIGKTEAPVPLTEDPTTIMETENINLEAPTTTETTTMIAHLTTIRAVETIITTLTGTTIEEAGHTKIVDSVAVTIDTLLAETREVASRALITTAIMMVEIEITKIDILLVTT